MEANKTAETVVLDCADPVPAVAELAQPVLGMKTRPRQFSARAGDAEPAMTTGLTG